MDLEDQIGEIPLHKVKCFVRRCAQRPAHLIDLMDEAREFLDSDQMTSALIRDVVIDLDQGCFTIYYLDQQ